MRGLAALRRFAAAPGRDSTDEAGRTRKQATPRCELCAAKIADEHDHLLEGTRKLVCSCGACVRLFPGRDDARYRRIERHAARIDLALPRELWDGLELPIGVAFLVPGKSGTRAIYPGAAGAVESTVPAEGWAALVAACPILRDLLPDVEALLVDRLGPTPRVFRVSIDLAFELAGILRRTWRGITGGESAKGGLEDFLARLESGEVGPCPS